MSPDQQPLAPSVTLPRRGTLPGVPARVWASIGSWAIVAGLFWATVFLVGVPIAHAVAGRVPAAYRDAAVWGGIAALACYAVPMTLYLVRIGREGRHGYRTTWEGSYWSRTWEYLDTVDGATGAILRAAGPAHRGENPNDVSAQLDLARRQHLGSPRPLLRGADRQAAREQARRRRTAYRQRRHQAQTHRLGHAGSLPEWTDRIGTSAALTVVHANRLRRLAWLSFCATALALFIVLPLLGQGRTWGWTVLIPGAALGVVSAVSAAYAVHHRHLAARLAQEHLRAEAAARPRPGSGSVPSVTLSSPDLFDLINRYRRRGRVTYKAPDPEPAPPIHPHLML